MKLFLLPGGFARGNVILAFGVTFFLLGSMVRAGDWPMWRYDSQRTASSPDSLPPRLNLSWRRQLTEPRPAWPSTQTDLQFDSVPEPVVAGKRIFVPCTATDSLSAYDTESGRGLWRYRASAPIRFAPAAADGKVYFVSDDGFLYCLDAASGTLLWKFSGGPAQRWILGNHRLVSIWPARGGPVLRDDKVYFAASIWSFMGIFIHCLDAESGRPIWSNSGDGTNYTVQPHGAPAFASIVPQGHLVLSGQNLIVPGGRSVPAVFDAGTGQMRYFEYDKKNGHYDVAAGDSAFYVEGLAYDMENGKTVTGVRPDVFDSAQSVYLDDDTIRLGMGPRKIFENKRRDRRGRETVERSLEHDAVVDRPIDGPLPSRIMIRCGDRLFGVTKDQELLSIDLSSSGSEDEESEDEESRTCRSTVVGRTDRPAVTMLAADDKLFVVDEAACLYCFADTEAEPLRHEVESRPLPVGDDRWTDLARRLLDASGARDGFAVVLGLENGRLIDELLLQSDLYVIAADEDEALVERLRERFAAAGLYGDRVSVHCEDPRSFALPPYLANLVASESGLLKGESPDATMLQRQFHILRPYGGVACFPTSQQEFARIRQDIRAVGLEGAELSAESVFSLLVRQGPLPDTDNWTHQYGNAAQTGISGDRQVRTPLGLLWFGGPSHDGILPRHGHGPSPQVAGGRLFIEGVDKLRSVDVYTGRQLWETELKDIGKHYNNTAHFSGANEVGSNYVSLPDHVYAVLGDVIWELDSATGQKQKAFRLEASQDDPNPYWGYIAAVDDLLIATSSPVTVVPERRGARRSGRRGSRDSGPPRGAESLIPPGAQWQYLAGGDPEDDTWTTRLDPAADEDDDPVEDEVDADADDAEEDDDDEGRRSDEEARPRTVARWRTGPAGFGFGDDDDATELDMQGKYTRVYIRREFEVETMEAVSKLGLVIQYDDAFAVYLNGERVLSEGLEDHGDGKYDVSSHEADGHEYFEIKEGRAKLKPGKNVLAIMGVNTTLDSSDFSLDPYLVFQPASEQDEESAEEAEVESGPVVAEALNRVRYGSGSRRLVVFDRHSGEQLWARDAEYSFRHNNISVGDDKIFCVDAITDAQKDSLERRGVDLDGFRPTIYALDLRTGSVIWQHGEQVFGSFLNYSAEHDLLIQAGSKSRDRADDEVGKGMTALRGSTGEVVWSQPELSYEGPCLLWRDLILTNGAGGFGIDISTGLKSGWEYSRNYGCNTAIGGENLLTFRSGAAGFFDLENDGGTGNFGGFRSSCTSNLIIADGVLSAPDYTRTCTCAYQNQTSLALVHMPDADLWTFGATDRPGQFGVNFGAPGDRRADNGTLWTDFPVVGGTSPEREVTIEGDEVQYFRHHASRIADQSLNWVAASGVIGPERIRLKLPPDCANGRATLRLVFAELEGVQAGDRAFDIVVQGETVRAGFDVAASHGINRVALEEFEVATGEELEIRLVPSATAKRPPVLCGLELRLNK